MHSANLVSLNLTGNQVSGTIPAELGNLSNLTDAGPVSTINSQGLFLRNSASLRR